MPVKHTFIIFLAIFVGLVNGAVDSINIEKITPINYSFDNKPIPLEHVKGTIHFTWDPQSAANQNIVDIDKVIEINGRVSATADFSLIRPANWREKPLVVWQEIPNRGGKASLSYFNAANTRTMSPSSSAHIGDGLLFRQGMAMLWVGWQFDVPVDGDRLRLYLPTAKSKQQQPITGRVRSDWVIDKSTKRLALAHRNHTPYPVVEPSSTSHVLTRRSGRDLERTLVPRDQWRFVELDGQPIKEIEAKEEFTAGFIYELVYLANSPKPVGLGLAAVRDTMDFLKNEKNDLINASHGIAFGVSQTGRFLRHFLYQGFNLSEQSRRVFDGMLIHTAGAGRGSFNHRFAQPSRDAHRYSAFFYPTDIFPFTSRSQKSLDNEKTDGLLDYYKRNDQLPKIMVTNSGYEYWGRASALIHTRSDGSQDMPLHPNERIYHFASGQHFVEATPISQSRIQAKNNIILANNLDYKVNLRALAVALKQWVSEGLSPPDSRIPKLANNTLIPFSKYRLKPLPDMNIPNSPHVAYQIDYGKKWGEGLVENQPGIISDQYPSLVPAIDLFGNELGGIRNVEIQVPLATYLPWQLRYGLSNANEMADFRGTMIPLQFNQTSEADQRPTISGLYETKQEYLKQINKAFNELVKQRFTLEEDRARIEKNANYLWQLITDMQTTDGS